MCRAFDRAGAVVYPERTDQRATRRRGIPNVSMVTAAIQHLEAGRPGEAETAARAVLAATPDDADALHILALACQRQGRAAEAATMLADVRKRQPKNPHAVYNHAVALQDAGEIEAAAAAYRDAIKLEPRDADAHYNLGAALRALGRLEPAMQAYRKAVAIRPEFSAAHNNLGNTLRDLGRDRAAMESYRAAIAADPGNIQAHVNLAGAAHRSGEDADAQAHFDTARALAPTAPEARRVLADGLIEADRAQAAFDVLIPHLADAPMGDEGWRALIRCLRAETPATVDDRTTDVLERLLDHPAAGPLDIAPALTRYLRRMPPVAACLSAQPDAATAATKLSQVTLLLKVMALTPMPDPKLEALFTTLRRGLLHIATDGASPKDAVPFAAALALQAFTNEYVFDTTEDEIAAARALAGDPTDPFRIAVTASYLPLTGLNADDALRGAFEGGPIAEVIRRQIAEPMAECEIAAAIPALTPIEDEVSERVRAQYEANPYPRWVKGALPRPASSLEAMLTAPPLDFEVRGLDAEAPKRVLIAGCGTGQHAAMVAARFPEAEVLAVDLSRSSLAFATRQAAALGLSNVRFAQADILRIGDIGETFDLIESVGVLHHMADPAAGWRNLTALLAPRGAMKIGLYSERARADVTAVANALKAEEFTDDADGIRAARAFVRARANNGDSAMAAVMQASDFYSMSEVRDLLFHVQESRLTLPAIKALIDDLGLHFLGFEIGDPAVLDTFKKAFPSPRARRSLADWDAFERDHPATFREMYQFWCQKK